MKLAGKGVVFTSSETEFLTAEELVLHIYPRICLVHTNDYNVWLTEVTVKNTWGRWYLSPYGEYYQMEGVYR